MRTIVYRNCGSTDDILEIQDIINPVVEVKEVLV